MTRLAPLSVAALVLALLLPVRAHAQESGRSSELSVERIMRDADTWVGSWPSDVRWHESGEWLYFDWNPEGRFPADSLYRVPRSGGEPVKVGAEERRSNPPFFDGWHHGEHVYSADRERKVYAAGGDLFLYDRASGEKTRLTDTGAHESDPRFSPDGERVIYRESDDLYALDLGTGMRRQLTDLRPGEGEADPDSTSQQEWLAEQQTRLFEVLRERNREEERREEAREADEEADDPPPTHHYGDGDLQQLRVGPGERFVTFSVEEEPPEAEETVVAEYVTLSGFTRAEESRPKVGIPPEEFDLYLQDLERDTTYRVDLHQLPGAYELPEYLQERGVERDSAERKRSLYSYGPYWSPEGEHAVLVVRADDNKDRWIARLDPESGDLAVLDRQEDPAWIGGPGISSYGGPGNVGWTPDGERFFFQSEATGWSHLYTVDAESGETEQLTAGEWEVSGARLDRDGSHWLLTTTEATPHERHVYRMPAGGGERTRLTDEAGMYGAAPSPDGQRLGLLYEYTNRPPDVYLQDARERAEKSRVTSSPTEEWLSYDWRDPEIVRFEASDGVEVPTQLFRPDDPNGAAVLFVHGAGYTQNVVRGWTHYFREYMFHNMLTDLGYTVVNVDYRGSAGYGRDWRTAIYRYMGGRDLGDYVDVSAWLESEYGIDPERQFVYGGSYGGFMTLMGLFTAPESFGGGAALRSVTDWAHYNEGYTSNILNHPQTDSTAYVRSSPIYHAEGLEDPLLMPHGLADSNVHAQDIFRLTQRLIELGKEDWELAIYPVEGHGFEEPSSWTDEYRRIFELIQESVGPGR